MLLLPCSYNQSPQCVWRERGKRIKSKVISVCADMTLSKKIGEKIICGNHHSYQYTHRSSGAAQSLVPIIGSHSVK